MRLFFVLSCLVLATSCDEGGSGLQQRLLELEAQRDAQAQKVAELQARLSSQAEKSPNTPAQGASSAAVAEDTGGSSDRAALIAAAAALGSDLAREMQPSALETYGQTQFVGFKLKKADGSFTNALVPFFSKGDGYWECGWSKDEVKAALQNPRPGAGTPVLPVVQPTVTQTPSPPTSMPPKNQAVYQPPPAPPPVVVSTKTQNAPDPDAAKLQPGERIVTLTDLDGNPQRAIMKADGTLRVIFK